MQHPLPSPKRGKASPAEVAQITDLASTDAARVLELLMAAIRRGGLPDYIEEIAVRYLPAKSVLTKAIKAERLKSEGISA
ncbi:MAG: hypothetical protein GY925_26365 [Actinomycetia bacterium]|nr:hypothetical protein [Actinomycetes bacterium]